MKGPNANLPTQQSCVQAVAQHPTKEIAPWNHDDGSGYNSNKPPSNIPNYFYNYAPCCNELPHSDFSKVNGNYSGSTTDLIKITACKWGIDENYIKAQAWIESGWHQDCAAEHNGTDCREGGDLDSPAGDPDGLPITSITPDGIFSAFDGVGTNFGRHWDSWSMLQTKVYYNWMTWPMMKDSTPFGLDYRFAEMRGCVNGHQAQYFNQNSDYKNAVARAKSNPNGNSGKNGWTNLQYLSYGCIDTHFSGDWFNGQSDEYLKNFLNILNNKTWNELN